MILIGGKMFRQVKILVILENKSLISGIPT